MMQSHDQTFDPLLTPPLKGVTQIEGDVQRTSQAMVRLRAFAASLAIAGAFLGGAVSIAPTAFSQAPELQGGSTVSGPTIPEPGPGDPRIRFVMYDKDQVVQLRGHLGYQLMIEFDPDERIENVSIGDSLSWQVTPNRKATRLFLKPMERGAATNMTVVSNLRTYTFELIASEASGPRDPRIIFGLRFTYPEPPSPPVVELPPPAPEPVALGPPTEDLNFRYTYKGAKTITPLRVFDDGRATWFEFRTDKDTPALFVIGPSGAEEIINSRIVGRYVVVDAVAEQFVLRYGRSRTTVRNEGYNPSPRSSPSDPPIQVGE